MASLPSKVPNLLGDSSLDRFDAVIIGSGAGGSAVARVLCTNGLKVCVLEAGNNYFQGLDDPRAGMPIALFSNDELKLSARDMIRQQTVTEPRSFRTSASDGDRTFVGDVNALPKTVGGAFVHADCKTPRFQEFDFRMGQALGEVAGADYIDWPFDYDELEPYYAAIERLIGVQGLDGADPRQPRRANPYPMPPGPDMYVANLLADGARKLGLTPFPYPSAITSRDYRGRPPCNDCGFCSGYGCPIHAKSSPAVTLLRDALLTGNCQVRYNSIATRIATSDGGRHATGVEYLDANGHPASISGDRIVLAGNAIESARLCLLSDLGGAGVGNSSGYVGRTMMFHYQTIAVGIYRQDLHGERGRSVTSGLTDFRGRPNDPDHPLGGIIEFGTNSEKISDARTYALDLGQLGSKLKPFLRSSPFGAHNAVLIMQGEDAPQASNRVDLDPSLRDINGLPCARVTYRQHALELAAREFYSPKMIELHGAAGAQFSFISPQYEGGVTPTSSHNMGTLRMGRDPRNSVTDSFGKFHDLDNLYAADGAILTTGSGYNPTLTIQACALRVGGAIVNATSPESVIER